MDFQISEYTKHIETLTNRAEAAFSAVGKKIKLDNQHDTIRLVFAGQYSAGKSSIIKMLTGRNDIVVGAGITTQKTHTYGWNGIEVIDTPGIHTELRPDHDKISYDAIASADMLVFVITNELFDSYLADHFRKLAIDRDKAGEMILVVNKMERAGEGNTPDQQEIIREDLRKVLDPYTPEQLNLCFLDAESYLDSESEKDADPELADELRERSGYARFIDILNAFVESKRLTGKVTTALYLLDEQLETAIHELEPQNEDADVAALEEHYLQQRHVLISARSQMQQEISDLYTSATARIRDLGLEAANLLVEGCKADEVETQLSDLVREVEAITDQCQHDADQLVEDRLLEMGQHLEANERSEFAQQLNARLTDRFEALPENLQKVLVGAGPGLQKIGQAVADKAYKAGVNGGLKLTNFSGSTVHNMILKAGHAIGFKFKPWQAVKWTKGVAIGGKVLGVLGVGFSIFMQLKSDQDEDKARLQLQRDRQTIRSQFNNAADEFDVFGRQYIQACVDQPLEEPIREIDRGLRNIRDNRKHQSAVLREMESIQHDCQNLIHQIHCTYKI